MSRARPQTPATPRPGWFAVLGRAMCLPALLAAAAAQLVVTWTPEAVATRGAVVASLVALGLGGGLAAGSDRRPRLRALAALAMFAGVVGLAAAAA